MEKQILFTSGFVGVVTMGLVWAFLDRTNNSEEKGSVSSKAAPEKKKVKKKTDDSSISSVHETQTQGGYIERKNGNIPIPGRK